MANTSVLTAFLIAAATAGLTCSAQAAPATGDPALRAELESVARRRIYFGHKSVGFNIMEGVSDLATQAGVPLRIVEVSESLAGASAGFLHGPVAENGDPVRKLESFSRTLESVPAPSVDIALLKFCFVDFGADTDAAALFARYQATIGALRARSPATTFVHVTVPLTTVQGGLKAFLKRLLGKKPYGGRENLRREEYNDLLRRAYVGREPVLDVARIESTTSDGKRFTVAWEGKPVPAMVPAYTEDGGHLNREGRLLVAREMVSVLAQVSRGLPGDIGRK